MISALDVAWYFVQQGKGDVTVTQLKLQKLCYYSQGFYLAKYGIPLFSEAIEAWDYGPVVSELRELHSHRGAETISPEEAAFGVSITDTKIIAVLDKVWILYGHYSAGKLVDMTHVESPWREAYGMGRNTRISEKMMLSYFVNHPHLNEVGVATNVCSGSSQRTQAVNGLNNVASENRPVGE